MVKGRKDGLAIYPAGRLDRRFWANDQNNTFTWERQTDHLRECCRREGWVAMKDISYTGGEDPAYTSIFRIFTQDVFWEEDDKDLVFGKVLTKDDEWSGVNDTMQDVMDMLINKVKKWDFIKDSSVIKLSLPQSIDKPPRPIEPPQPIEKPKNA